MLIYWERQVVRGLRGRGQKKMQPRVGNVAPNYNVIVILVIGMEELRDTNNVDVEESQVGRQY